LKDFQSIIKELKLKPHPEGGYFRETYRSRGSISAECLDNDYQGRRNFSTAIYFLLTSDLFSAFHRLHQDEMWHFYDGSPLALHVISKDGLYQTKVLGRCTAKGEELQIVVRGGDWFAATVVEPNSYTLAGCTVSPGFDFEDFKLANREELVARFPQHRQIIEALTRS